MEFNHKPVLLNECIEGLNIKPNGIYVDGTLGGGGHSLEILKRLNNTGKLIGIDRDKQAIQAATERLSNFSNFIAFHGNHDDILSILERLGIQKVDGILFDLGVSSYQLDEPSRGFSYMHDGKLDMRMDQDDIFSAFDVINKYSEERLAKIFFEYGEERYSRSIAKNICLSRKIKPIETTFELVDVIKRSMPSKALNEKQHPAKRVFQAIRIEVNSELNLLKQTINDSVNSLNAGGRLLVISFQSLEDKIVKHTYEDLHGRCTCPPDFPICVCGCKSYGNILTKKPIEATEDEKNENTRSRSAKLRIFEKI